MTQNMARRRKLTGRPPIAEPLEEVIVTRCSTEERRALEAGARRYGWSLSKYVRAMLRAGGIRVTSGATEDDLAELAEEQREDVESGALERRLLEAGAEIDRDDERRRNTRRRPTAVRVR